MDLKDKIVGLALVALISLVGWNLKTTWEMKEQVFKLQQGQIIVSEQIKKNTNFVKRNIKKQNKKNKKKKKKNNE
tara:strand:- start:83 stop:307 length:225 start_codon:yes stop_codon:yes gene_type:complete